MLMPLHNCGVAVGLNSAATSSMESTAWCLIANSNLTQLVCQRATFWHQTLHLDPRQMSLQGFFVEIFFHSNKLTSKAFFHGWALILQ